ncbi:hypothetical protein PVAND_010522 [Polypedilum vanderplanki]|uniref:Uncharacterized protein n=1 Tax=Polypedilum vanderplanki TaxID=319348 RepID=A0A9J6CGU7_POLVA|nr:hypothetical protein PVAND_010522 [Polypedilum vanderplanki]
MAQGKNKVKAKLPANAKHKTTKTNKQNSAFQKRKNAPAKQKLKDKQKIQLAITKSVNQKNEEEMKSRALSHQTNLSVAQKAVAKHHDKKGAQSSSKANEMQTDS